MCKALCRLTKPNFYFQPNFIVFKFHIQVHLLWRSLAQEQFSRKSVAQARSVARVCFFLCTTNKASTQQQCLKLHYKHLHPQQPKHNNVVKIEIIPLVKRKRTRMCACPTLRPQKVCARILYLYCRCC